MLTTVQVRNDLKEIRYYYSMKELFDRSSKTVKPLAIVQKVERYNIIAIKRLYAKGNTKHNIDTLPLRIYKTVTGHTTEPLKRFVRQYAAFVKEHNFIWIIWLVIWIFNLNFATIIIEFFAYYFYFAVSFDFGSIYMQIVKLIIDLLQVVVV